MPDTDVSTELQRQYTRQVQRVSDALRTAADRIDREGQPNASSAHPCSTAAANVVHELHAALANLPTWQLIANAADADSEASSPDPA